MKRQIDRSEGLFSDSPKPSLKQLLSKIGIGSGNFGTGADSELPDELNSGDLDINPPGQIAGMNQNQAGMNRAEQLRQRTWPLGRRMDLNNIKANPYQHVNDIPLLQQILGK